MLGINDYEELLTGLGSASNLLLRGPAGFTVEARTGDGRRAPAGEPAWDLDAAITSTDWSGLDGSIA